MRRHNFDSVSFVFGALFAVIGLTFLFGNADIADLHLAVIWPLPLILIGVLMLATTVQRRTRHEAAAPATTGEIRPAAVASATTTDEIAGLDEDDDPGAGGEAISPRE
jgi:hypothetical protein